MNTQKLQHAQRLHQQGKLDEALTEYHRLLEKAPDNITIIQMIVLLNVQLGYLKRAAEFIQHAIKRLPSEPSLYNSLGNILARQKKIDAAIGAYQQAIEKNPNYPGALSNLGNCHLKLQHIEQARKYYEQALMIDPDYPDAHFNIARLYLQEGHVEKAIAHLEQVIRIAPQHAAALGQLGHIYLQQGDYHRAMTHLNKRILIQPNAESYYTLASAAMQINDYLEAIDALRHCLKQDPEHAEAKAMLANAFFLTGDKEQALAFYLRCLEHGPHLESLYNIGVILSDKHHLNEAIDYFQQALTLEPHYLPAHLNIAALYLSKQNLSKAIQHYQSAQQLDPENEEIQHILHGLTQDQIPETSPILFAKNLFNQYAPHYDKHLLEQLNYQVPREIHRCLLNTVNFDAHDLRILDLGCGTGLCGEFFYKSAKELIGVDVAQGMLAIAEAKQIYTKLIHGSLETVLPEFNDLDFVLAADVFPYIGALETIFRATYNALRHNGYFAFSIENTTAAPYVLQTTLRYAHNKNYIKTLSDACNFIIVCENNIILRHQQKKPMEGYLFILQKP